MNKANLEKLKRLETELVNARDHYEAAVTRYDEAATAYYDFREKIKATLVTRNRKDDEAL